MEEDKRREGVCNTPGLAKSGTEKRTQKRLGVLPLQESEEPQRCKLTKDMFDEIPSRDDIIRRK